MITDQQAYFAAIKQLKEHLDCRPLTRKEINGQAHALIVKAIDAMQSDMPGPEKQHALMNIRMDLEALEKVSRDPLAAYHKTLQVRVKSVAYYQNLWLYERTSA